MKKILIISLTLLIGLFFSPLLASEAAAKDISATTTTDLNVREKPNANAKKVGVLKKNSKIVVHEQLKSGWSKITFNKKTAYVNSKYVKVTTTTTSWNGVYTYKTSNKDVTMSGDLKITNHKGNQFNFDLLVLAMYNSTGGFEGYANYTAKVNGNTATATFSEDGNVCKLTFKKTNSTIKVQEMSQGCEYFRGYRAPFNGTYKK